MKWLLKIPAAALFLDPGLGKTSITLAAFHFLKSKNLASKMLVIAPLRVCHSVWPNEVKKWTEFKDLKVVVLHGPDKDKLLKENADIYVINPEGLEWFMKATCGIAYKGISSAATLKSFSSFGFDTLVIDELSKFKHHNTKRAKLLLHYLPTFKRRWGLTGSPAANGLLDLFGQMKMIDLGKSLGKYITHYRAMYFTQLDPNGWTWGLRPGAADEIYEKLSTVALRMSSEDFLKLPERVEETIYVDLPPDVFKFYRELEDELIALIDGDHVVAANAAVASMKCRQIACGGIYLPQTFDKPREWKNLHDMKTDAVADLIDELQGKPVFIAYDFEHDRDRLLKRFGLHTPYIGGGISPKRTDEIIRDWNNGNIPILLGHPQSVAHGLNLQEGQSHYIIWHSLTWDYELYDQFNSRIWRQGNTAPKVFIYHIIARKTVDEIVFKALRRKRTGQNNLFAALKELSTKSSES